MALSFAENAKSAARWRLPVALGVAALCYLLLLALGGRLLGDPDIYWQIALGKWMAAHGAVPHADTFSWTMDGAPWISSQWLAQVLFAQSYAAAGWAGVVVLAAAAIALAFGLLAHFLMLRLATGPALVLTAAALVLVSPHLVARPHALALPVMVAWVAGLMRAADARRSPSFALLPLMVLWANLHGGFTLGIAFIAPLVLEALWQAAPAERLRVVVRWGGFALLALVAACVTPYGPESVLVTLRILGLGDALALIREWRPQDFSTLAGFEIVLLLGVGFALYRGLTLPPLRILMLLGLVHMALAHVRYAEVLGLLAPLLIAAPLAPQIGRREDEPVQSHQAAWPASLAIVLLLGAVSLGAAQALAYRPDPRISPPRALAAMKASGKTHVLNSYDFGGSMIAAGVKPYIDGRTELYGRDFVVRHDKALTLNGVDTFLNLLRDKDIDVTLLAPATPAVGLLDRLQGWTRVYADDVAIVHVRNGAAGGETLR